MSVRAMALSFGVPIDSIECWSSDSPKRHRSPPEHLKWMLIELLGLLPFKIMF